MKRYSPPERIRVKVGPVRDWVHLREITHGSGCGFHPSKQDRLRREARRKQQRGWQD